MKKVLLLALFAGLISAGAQSPKVGYQSFADFDQLWVYDGKVKTAMSSSTDVKGGNMDMWNFHGHYRGEPVLARIEGPGSVYRVWSAFASGWIKVYIDGKSRPEICCGFKNYLKGKCAGLPGNFSVGRTANYMPIPFARSIIITAPGFNFPAYYQVSFQSCDRSVEVKSFSRESAKSGEAFESAASAWRNFGSPLQAGMEFAASGKDRAALDLKAAGVIRSLAIADADNPSDPLKAGKLEIFWDGNARPAVDAPVDAFFINQPDLKDKWPGASLKSFFIAAGKNGYSAKFPMPFANGAKVSVSAPGKNLKITALVEKRDSLPQNAMRFHAFYKAREFPENEKRENIFTLTTPVDPKNNWVALEEQGKGKYIGCAIFVKSVGTVWWGEGDEMTYIDGSAKPQIQGTGTEDEFNWSWGYAPHMSPVSGTLPVIPACKESIVAQIIPILRNKECQKVRGDNIGYRFRPSDYVPFEKSIKVSYEILGNAFLTPHPIGNLSQERGDDYASVAYWYELP